MRDNQVDRKTRAEVSMAAQDFGPTSLLEEKMNGGYTPLTKPTGAEPARTITSSTRGASDSKALSNPKGDND